MSNFDNGPKRGSKKAKDENDYPQYRSFPLYALLVCGLLIAIIGLYLILIRSAINGITFPGRMGIGGGKAVSINGPFILATGLSICIFPIYQLVKNKRSQ